MRLGSRGPEGNALLKTLTIISSMALGAASLPGAAGAMSVDHDAGSAPIETVQYYGGAYGGGYGPRYGGGYGERRASPERIIGRALGLRPRHRGYRGEFRGRGNAYGRRYRGGY